ncbi:Sugar kinase of the NBD/HSP70 family, may contain an N-terminal HTH domain [Pilibacter termitis]|uniref:Sugar kinase of the NBD/HSP70 family, may contain an N-terminal HTH domain n=1 Tax=Pilibacter termitis TaxID=263852 RepID=A0A1T4MAX0_9ENTE|nr:ROK family protein [Pilibacter termitis]SJZ63996.1 Sugar kinase of the NBD/HSP70 family, may contain an N-terminal HTH domain [Pilibacter termitis]
MKKIACIDVGGTSIKYAVFQNGQLFENGSFPTPQTLEEYYEKLCEVVEEMKKVHGIVGVAMSSPGAVNKENGVIEGASALPYIHDFDIHSVLSDKFALPLTIENDANCAALAEVKYGVAKNHQNVLFIVLGTGVGGSVIVDGKIHHGKHLFGGEFGFMLMSENETFSSLGTAVNMASRYNKRMKTNLSGKEVFERAFSGDVIAQEEAEVLFSNVAKGIFNLQYAFDPELVVLGGGISQAEFLLPEIDKRMDEIMKKVTIAPFKPKVVKCHFLNDANLIGAASDFLAEYGNLCD